MTSRIDICAGQSIFLVFWNVLFFFSFHSHGQIHSVNIKYNELKSGILNSFYEFSEPLK